MRLPAANGLGISAACLMAGLIGAVALTGRWPVDAPRTHAEAGGILSIPVDRVARLEIAAAGARVVGVRVAGGGWLIDDAPSAPSVAGHIATALRLLASSPPRRVLATGEYPPGRLAEYGLDPPGFVVAAQETGASAVRIGFGEATPTQNAQYVRIVDRPELYLLPRDVGSEWRLVRDMALRPARLLLPISIAQIWAVEIIRGGIIQRFERDPAGLWFHHVGQHVHLPGGFVHKADPKLAARISAEFDKLDRLSITGAVAHHPDDAALSAAGLRHPSTIMLLYSRDSAGPVARIELGNTASDGSGRHAYLQQSDSLVAAPAEIERPLATLIEIAGGS